MQGFDALRAALNPFSLAQRRKVPAGHGRGRQIVFAVDSSSFRLVSPRRVKRASLLSTTSADLSPSSRVLRSEQAVRFGLDNVARGNDAVAFACVYKKANLQPPDVGPFVDGVPVSTERDEQLRKEAERKDKARCEAACARFVEDAKAAGVASASAEIMSCGASGGGGSVADVLEQYAASTRADLLVVGSRGAGASTVGSLLRVMGLGSVSEHLVRHAEVPVLVVKRRSDVAPKETNDDSATRDASSDARRESLETKPKTKPTTARGDDDFLGPPEQGFAKGTR